MSNEDLLIKVFFSDGNPAFIFWVNGGATIEMLQDIEDELNNDDFSRPQNDGDYQYAAHYVTAQTDGCRIEIPAHWELTPKA